MPEIDLDAFSFGDEILLEQERARPQRPAGANPDVIAAIDREDAGTAMQMTMEGGEVPHARNVTPVRQYLRAIVYTSRSDPPGEPHIIVFHETPEGVSPLCSCKATRNLARRPQGCWATIDARDIAGLPQPEVP